MFYLNTRVNIQTEKQAQQLAIHSRFYTALALHDLVNEVPLPRVSEKYQGCNSIDILNFGP